MTDPRETLARIRAQADAATEGPWELLGDGEYVSGPGILVAPDDGGVTSADARTTVPALLDALEAVLEIHQDGGESQGYLDDGSYGDMPHCCTECGSLGEYGVLWPCPTVEAITTALEGKTHD